ncbi:MAG: ribonuclease HIII [Chlamydiales bacterium]
MTAPFVATIDLKLAGKLKQDLIKQEFEISTPPHTCFSAKKRGVSCTLYSSGKLVVQGKESAEFLEFYLEPEILGTFTFTHPLAECDLTPHIGIDESGKGDFFGPLCIAGVFVNSDQFALLQSAGVKDSKNISDPSIRKIAAKIRSTCLYHVVRINPPKYNEIYANFQNLNKLLAWGHATAIEKLVEKSGCKEVIVDQFANESVVKDALKRKNLVIKLTQRHRAEEDLAVAAASILARDAFLEGLEKLGSEIGLVLPKGSSSLTSAAGKQILEKWGIEKLMDLCKHHFKTLDAIVGKRRES